MHHWRPLCGNLFKMCRQKEQSSLVSITERNFEFLLFKGAFLFLLIINKSPANCSSVGFCFCQPNVDGKIKFSRVIIFSIWTTYNKWKREMLAQTGISVAIILSHVLCKKIIQFYLNSLSRYIFTQAKIGNGLPDIWRFENTGSKFWIFGMSHIFMHVICH